VSCSVQPFIVQRLSGNWDLHFSEDSVKPSVDLIRRREPASVASGIALGLGFKLGYFPWGTDLSTYSQAQLDQVSLGLNQRPI